MKLTKELAYFLGVHIGDGTMDHYRKYDYYISYSGHIIDEKEFYSIKICNLIKSLFKISPSIRFDNRHNKSSIRLTIYSKKLFNILTKDLGLGCGPKSSIAIPKIIKDNNEIIKRSFIRGLADTDFSLTFKKRNKNVNYYPTITFSSNNKKLVKEVNSMLINLEFNTTTTYDRICRRNNKINLSNSLDINGTKQLSKWMKEIGFNSNKHLTKYLVWKKYGFCPAYTNILDRKKILGGEII